eukprot:gene1266-1849_t
MPARTPAVSSVHDGSDTSEDIPDDNFVPESVVHGCRDMTPKEPPSFVRHVVLLPLLAVMCAFAFDGHG